MNGKFWMVLGSQQPNYRHTSKQSAQTEAERLAKSHPSQAFFVLEALASVRVTDLRWETLDPNFSPSDNDVPF